MDFYSGSHGLIPVNIFINDWYCQKGHPAKAATVELLTLQLSNSKPWKWHIHSMKRHLLHLEST